MVYSVGGIHQYCANPKCLKTVPEGIERCPYCGHKTTKQDFSLGPETVRGAAQCTENPPPARR